MKNHDGRGGDQSAGFGQTGNAPVDNSGIAATSAGTSVGVPAWRRRSLAEWAVNAEKISRKDAKGTQRRKKKSGMGCHGNPGFHPEGMPACSRGLRSVSDDTPGTREVARRPWKGRGTIAGGGRSSATSSARRGRRLAREDGKSLRRLGRALQVRGQSSSGARRCPPSTPKTANPPTRVSRFHSPTTNVAC